VQQLLVQFLVNPHVHVAVPLVVGIHLPLLGGFDGSGLVFDPAELGVEDVAGPVLDLRLFLCVSKGYYPTTTYSLLTA
jgi:hypothetical protein